MAQMLDIIERLSLFWDTLVDRREQAFFRSIILPCFADALQNYLQAVEGTGQTPDLFSTLLTKEGRKHLATNASLCVLHDMYFCTLGLLLTRGLRVALSHYALGLRTNVWEKWKQHLIFECSQPSENPFVRFLAWFVDVLECISLFGAPSTYLLTRCSHVIGDVPLGGHLISQSLKRLFQILNYKEMVQRFRGSKSILRRQGTISRSFDVEHTLVGIVLSAEG